MRLVILQPFYLPYLGVFELIRLADAFLFYDDVQFVTQNWISRNRVKTPHGPRWITVPTHKESHSLIKDVQIANRQPWGRKHWATISQSYARAPHFDDVEKRLGPYYDTEWSYLVDLNIQTISELCEALDVGARFLRSSEMPLESAGSQRVLNYCLELGATHYLTGPSAQGYLDEASFEQAGITLEYFRFEHPVYRQPHGEFVPYMSAVDLLASEGPGAPDVLHGSGSPVPVQEWDQ